MMRKNFNQIRKNRSYLLTQIATCLITLFSVTAEAAIVFYTDQVSFLQNAGYTDSLVTNTDNLTKANEVNGEPGRNTPLGNTLTFKKGETRFPFTVTLEALESGSSFVYDDDEGDPLTNYDLALSVGDLDNYEDDDWSITISEPYTAAVGFVVWDNNFPDNDNSNEMLTVNFERSGTSMSEVFDLAEYDLGNPANQFLGVIATNGDLITQVLFDEFSGGDDMAVADFQLGMPSPTLPNTMLMQRSGYRSLLLLNNKVLIAGGFVDDTEDTSAVELFDPATGKFSSAAYMNSSRSNFTMTMLANGNVLVVGGSPFTSGEGAEGTAEIYDYLADNWRTVPSMTHPRTQHTATRLADGRILVVGGLNTDASSGHEIYDPASNTWSTAYTGGNFNLRGHTATLVDSGEVRVTGGLDLDGSAGTWVYNPDADSWSNGPDMERGRSEHTATVWTDGRLAVVGGERGGDNGNTCVTNTGLEWLSSLSNSPSWQSLDHPPSIPKCQHSGGLLPDGRLFVASTHPTGTSEIEIYNEDEDRWIFGPTGFLAQELPSSTMLQDGRIMMMTQQEPYLFDFSHKSVSQGPDLEVPRISPSLVYLGGGELLVTSGNVDSASMIYFNQSFAEECGLSTCLDEITYPGNGMVTINTDKHVFFSGGFNGTYSDRITILELKSGQSDVEQSGTLIIPRASHQVNLLQDGRVLIIGGYPEEANGTAEIYDPATNKTSFAGELNTDRVDAHESIVLHDGRVLVVGGLGTFEDPAEIYDPETNSWRSTSPFNEPRSGMKLAMLPDGRVMAAGGSTGLGVNNVDIFNPKTNQWMEAPAMQIPRKNHSLTALPNGQILAVGGIETSADDSNSAESSTELYDPVMNTWSRGPDLPIPARNHSAIAMEGNNVLIVGGIGDAASSTRVFSYDKNVPVLTNLNFTVPDKDSPLEISSLDVQMPSNANSGNTRESAGNTPLIQIRSFDGNRSAYITPSIDNNWISNTSVYRLSETANVPRGPVFAIGYVNGRPLKQTQFDMPFLPIAEEFCFPIKVDNGRSATICI